VQDRMGQLLLAEDDDLLALPLEWALVQAGFEVDRARSGEEVLLRHARGGVDLILLDLGLPDIDGLEVCRRIRAADPRVAIVMVTGRTDELDRVIGLDVGADDYLAKPFALAELLARIRAGLRRSRATSDPTAPVTSRSPAESGLRVDTQAHQVHVGATEVHLTPREFDLLALLDAERGRVVTRERLMDEVWDVNWFGSTKTLDVTIRRLRQKLQHVDTPVTVVTVRGVGFRLEVGAEQT
jgi:DNA-binding response OmpR family regulator